MYTSLVAFFSSLIVRAPPRLLRRFRYRAKRLLPDPSMDMAEEPEKARVTELLVRMDCNGCVQRIKRALHNIEGVYEVYTDIAQQKLTVVGRADPERIVKAIKRTKKTATICSHIDPGEPVPPANEEPPSGESPAAEQPAPAAEALPATEPPMNPPVEQEARLEMSSTPPEVRMVHEYPHHSGHRDYQSGDPYYYGMNVMRPYENTYSYATHSYNSYRPSNYVSEYYHGYTRSPVQGPYVMPAYSNTEDYPRRERTDGQITSAFSDENPNACNIV